MAVQARHLPHDFPFPPVMRASSLFSDDYAACCAPTTAQAAGVADTTVLSDFPASDLTGGHYGFLPRKRARVAAEPGGFFVDQCVPAQGLMPLPVTTTTGDVQSRVGSGAASTSGRVAVHGATLPSYHDDGDEIDALIRLQSERMRLGLEHARRRHTGAVVAAVCRAASKRVRAAEAELERALRRNAELEEKARQVGTECQAWMRVATSHEAVASGLRATLHQLLLQSPATPHVAVPTAGGEGGDAEDAQSCCFEAAADADDGGAAASRSKTTAAKCRSCGGGDACVLVLPCRHLCLCVQCEAGVEACPVCAAAKNASLLVLFS